MAKHSRGEKQEHAEFIEVDRMLKQRNRAPGGIRTPNLLIRSQKLYPVELQAQKFAI
jgi:hypothetical protein